MSAVIDTAEAVTHTPAVELTTVERLIIVRRRRRLTIGAAAARWSMKPRTLHAWEQGTRFPNATNEAALKRIIRDEERRGF
jgi:DNA-binding transcriptional regulator YiaG